jgi:uncharacterized membrane protein YfcA
MRRWVKYLIWFLCAFVGRFLGAYIFYIIGENFGLVPSIIYGVICFGVLIGMNIYEKKHPRKPKEQVPEKVDPSEIPEWVKEEERKEREQKNENP